MISATHKQVINTMNWYEKHKIPYDFELQNETISVISDKGSYSTSRREYTLPEINFIKEVKQHIVKNGLQEPYRYHFKDENRDSVRYFEYHPSLKPGQLIEGLDNVDATAAYWETANKFGLFEGRPDLYERGLSWEPAMRKIGGDPDIAEVILNDQIKKGKSDVIRKQVRLAAIGSLAKRKTTWRFDGKKQFLVGIKKSEETEFLWDLIAEHIGEVLQNIAKQCGSDFVYFWVDGIYVKAGKKKLVQQLFKKAGYGCKSYTVPWVKTTDRHIILKCPEKTREEERGGQKILVDEFSFPFRHDDIEIIPE